MTSKFYAQKRPKTKGSPLHTTTAPPLSVSTLPLQPSACDLVRFILKSGQHLDLQLDSIEEVTEDVCGVACMCICGIKDTGEKVILPWNNVDFLEEVE